MAKNNKLGSQANDLFQNTAEPNQKIESTPKPGSAPVGGRPKFYQGDAVEKTTLTLYRKHLLLLDRLALDVKEQSGVCIDRGAIIRGLLAAVEESGIDLRSCQNESDVTKAIQSVIGMKNG